MYLDDSLQWNTRPFLAKQEKVIAVPEGPPLEFPSEVAADPGLFDAVIDQMLALSERNATASAFASWLAKQPAISGYDAARLTVMRAWTNSGAKGATTSGLRRTQFGSPHLVGDAERASRRRDGNPPWISFRYMSATMKERFRDESKARALWAGAKVATHQDLSAYFFARTAELYLRGHGCSLELGARQACEHELWNRGVDVLSHLQVLHAGLAGAAARLDASRRSDSRASSRTERRAGPRAVGFARQVRTLDLQEALDGHPCLRRSPRVR